MPKVCYHVFEVKKEVNFMENKYNMTLEQNIFLAKRNLVDNVYANAKMEGINITFSQTKTIIV